MTQTGSGPGDPGDVTDSPEPSVAAHIRRYLATDGSDGYLEGGMPNLLLTTVGRRTGRRRRTALFFGDDGPDRLVVIGSGFAGGPRRPSWYLNLVTEPVVEVQVRGERFAARARTAVGAERERLWRAMTARVPAYRAYQARSPREVPVVVLERM
jgi:deazaflavin-dependent oxidoreductase (nitroreductase family)